MVAGKRNDGWFVVTSGDGEAAASGCRLWLPVAMARSDDSFWLAVVCRKLIKCNDGWFVVASGDGEAATASGWLWWFAGN